MLFRTANDWKQLLSVDDEEQLNAIIRKIAKYRGAYRNSDQIKNAQIWCAILELVKQNIVLQKRLNTMEDIFETVYENQKKRELEERALFRSLDRF